MTDLAWADRTWTAREVSDVSFREPPGPNLWSDTAANISVTGDELTLTVKQDAANSNLWSSTEATSQESLGYGLYEWVVETSLNALDRNTVLSLSVYSDDTDFQHRFISIDYSNFGVAAPASNARFYVMGTDGVEYIKDFIMPSGTETKHRFKWTPSKVEFSVYESDGTLVDSFVVGGNIPPPGNELVRTRYWQYQTLTPFAGTAQTIVVQDFVHHAINEEFNLSRIRQAGGTSTSVGRYVASEEAFLVTGRNRKTADQMPLVWCHDYSTVDSVMPELRRWDEHYDEMLSAAVNGFPTLVADLGGGETWGNDTAIDRVDSLLDFGATELETRTNQVVLAGVGMGALTALNWAWRHPGQVAAVWLVAPVVHLENFKDTNDVALGASIEAAYTNEAGYLAALDTHDPSRNTTLIRPLGRRLKIWYDEDDALVDPVDVLTFATRTGCEVATFSSDSFDIPVDDLVGWAVPTSLIAREDPEVIGARVPREMTVDYREMWLDYIRDAGTVGGIANRSFLGGDMVDVVDLGSNSYMWIGADWWAGAAIDPDTDFFLTGALPFRNGVVSEGPLGTLNAQLFTGGGSGGDWVDPQSDGGLGSDKVWWTVGGVRPNLSGTAFIVAHLVGNGGMPGEDFVVEDTSIISLNLFGFYASHVNTGWGEPSNFWLSSLYHDPDDNFVYGMGTVLEDFIFSLTSDDVEGWRNVPPGIRKIARVPEASVATISAWQFWNGSTWVTNDADAAVPLVDMNGNERMGITGNLTKIRDGHWLTVGRSNVLDTHVDVFRAAQPQGPWDLIARVPDYPVGAAMGDPAKVSPSQLGGGIPPNNLQVSHHCTILPHLSSIVPDGYQVCMLTSTVLFLDASLGTVWTNYPVGTFAPRFLVVPETRDKE